MLQYGSTVYTYSANEELETKTDGTGQIKYNYDAFRNSTHVDSPDGRLIDYVIDGEYRLIGKKVNGIPVQGFLYGDQLNPAAELDRSGNILSRFKYGTRSNLTDYFEKCGVRYRIISDEVRMCK